MKLNRIQIFHETSIYIVFLCIRFTCILFLAARDKKIKNPSHISLFNAKILPAAISLSLRLKTWKIASLTVSKELQ